MAHRGRLNVLVNTLGKSPRKLFDEFEGKFEHAARRPRPHRRREVPHGLLAPTSPRPAAPCTWRWRSIPSHLEIVDPVVAGSVRSRQERRGDSERKQVLPVLIHGDAAFAGQGVVMELFQMSQARGFAVGGTVHIVINNQVGFTTSDRDDARSTLYCTDVAKMVGAPVLHVNGDDPEAVVFCAELAFDFRQQFEQGRGHRPGLLPPPRPQRGRRAGRHPAADVPGDPRAPDHARAVRDAAGRPKA